jgi:8-oxo-dGTP pyrophosphatase MutT (NUDIX family)
VPQLQRAHVFVVRDGRILALRQASARGWWEFPGGDLEPGEMPADAAIRETREECGLIIEAPTLLREWRYRSDRGIDVVAHAFASAAPHGDVALSHEHVECAWLTVDEYERRYCSAAVGAAAPQYADFLAEMRENCRLFREWMLTRSNS